MTIFHRETGLNTSPAIVFLHGGGLSSLSWQPVMERLPEFHCLAPDLPQQGQSADVKPFTLRSASDLTAELIREKVPSGKAVVVGLSLGGATVLEMLAGHPEVIERAMTTGSAAKLSKFLIALTNSSMWMMKLMKPESTVEATLKQQGIPEQYRSLAYDDLLTSTKDESFLRASYNCLGEDMRLPLENKIPLLACVGGKETRPAKDAAKKILREVPNTTGVMVPGLNHVWALQDPDLFAATVRAWALNQPLPAALVPLQ